MKLDILGTCFWVEKGSIFDDFSSFFTFLHKIFTPLFHFCQNRSEIDSKLLNVHIKNPWLNDMCALMYTLVHTFVHFDDFSIFIFANFYQKTHFFIIFCDFCDFSCFLMSDLVEYVKFQGPFAQKHPQKQRFSTILGPFSALELVKHFCRAYQSAAKFRSGSFSKPDFDHFSSFLTFWRPFLQLLRPSEVFYTGISLFLDPLKPIKITSEFDTFGT